MCVSATVLVSSRWFACDNRTLSRAGESVICSDFCRKPSSPLNARGYSRGQTKDKSRGYSRARRSVTAMRVLNESADSADNVAVSLVAPLCFGSHATTRRTAGIATCPPSVSVLCQLAVRYRSCSRRSRLSVGAAHALHGSDEVIGESREDLRARDGRVAQVLHGLIDQLVGLVVERGDGRPVEAGGVSAETPPDSRRHTTTIRA